MEYEESSNRRTKKTVVSEHSFKEPLYIPTYPAINPEKIFNICLELSKTNSPAPAILCLFIQTQLQRVDQKGVVVLDQGELSRLLNISKPTINKAFDTLVSLNILTKVGKSSWKVSPEFAWVGSHVEWAEELKALETGSTYTVEVRQIHIEEI